MEILQYIFSFTAFSTYIFASVEVPETTYVQMGVGGQIHIILGVLDMKRVEHPLTIETHTFQKTIKI